MHTLVTILTVFFWINVSLFYGLFVSLIIKSFKK